MKKARILIVLAMMLLLCTMAEAKTKSSLDGIITRGGQTFIFKQGKLMTGYFTYRGKHYYGHKTGSKKYPVGSVTKGQFKIKPGNRWYAYGLDGVRYEKDHYIRWGRHKKRPDLTINPDHTVRYVWQVTSTRCRRYSTADLRMQKETSSGWRLIEGMQYIPDGWVDYQE